MRALLCAGWLVLVACGRKHDDGKLTISTDLTTHSDKASGPADVIGKKLADAKPALTVTASDPRLADGARAVLAASDKVKPGALKVDIVTIPATPVDPDGTVEVRIGATAVFAHLPEIITLAATINGKVKYTNLDARELGGELGKKVLAWIDGEKLPANLGLPTGPAAPAKQVAVAAATCSLHADGSVRCWGRDAQEIPMPSLKGATALAGANQFGACGVRPDGHVFCIDAWDEGIAFAARNACGIERATAISVGQQTACALRDDGHVQCWAKGPAWYEPCDKGHPAVEVTGLANAVAIDVGPFRGCALLRDGTVSCWEHCDARCKSGVVGKVDTSPVARPLKSVPKATQVSVSSVVYVIDGNRIAPEPGAKMPAVTVPEPVSVPRQPGPDDAAADTCFASTTRRAPPRRSRTLPTSCGSTPISTAPARSPRRVTCCAGAPTETSRAGRPPSWRCRSRCSRTRPRGRSRRGRCPRRRRSRTTDSRRTPPGDRRTSRRPRRTARCRRRG